jgi:tryptophanase
MKSKYEKLKYTNTGVKAPVVTLMKSSTELCRSNMIELNYPEVTIVIRRIARKTMYNRSMSLINIKADHFIASFYVHDTINDARVVCENIYLIIKKPELDFRITTMEYNSIYEYMKGVVYNAKES